MTVGETVTDDEEDDTTNYNTDVCCVVAVRSVKESSGRFAQVCARRLGRLVGQSK